MYVLTNSLLLKSENLKKKNNTGWVMQSVGFLETNGIPLVGLHIVAEGDDATVGGAVVLTARSKRRLHKKEKDAKR